MAGIDKAAIGFSIAIVAIGVAFALYGDAAQNQVSVVTPTTSKPMAPVPQEEPKTQNAPFADIANKVKEEAPMEKEKAPMEKEETVAMKEEVVVEKTPVPAGPTTHTVDIPAGTSAPGCEETNSCFSPASITINAGDTIEWVNGDTAAHTVTSGSPADGPDGVFDSSLVMGSASYSFTFEDAGSYSYFCMVHPWMTGSVTVN